ncbi:helix-turn-helix domain-containing protein [Streptomyces roseolus]|uniref:helix-turn-helix domain-containing protein n=1 Tax=Streptomyces roseolus TaxID=67358 RepID=UPI003799FFB8
MTPNGTAIREIRKLRGMAVRALAASAGLHHTHLSRVERGEAGVGEANLRAIADVLGVPVAAINREELS